MKAKYRCIILFQVYLSSLFYFSSETFKQKLDSVPDQTSSEEQMENSSKGRDFKDINKEPQVFYQC